MRFSHSYNSYTSNVDVVESHNQMFNKNIEKKLFGVDGCGKAISLKEL